MDNISAIRRSENMRRIRGGNTAPERALRHALSAAKVRYRIHRPNLPGRPDVSIGRIGLAIFVHGCFWHQHQGCPRSFTPTSHKEYWIRKFQANVARDVKVLQELRVLGWRSKVIWECQTRNKKDLKRRLKATIQEYRESSKWRL